MRPQEDRSCRRKSGSDGSRRELALKAAGATAVAVLLALVTSACGGTASSESSSSDAQPDTLQRVTSTLDGETTIPLRTRWIATPQPAGAPVTEVDFLIDGKLIWTEQAAPYVFGGDDNGTNLGFLITTWLSPGMHTFTARATGVAGKTVSDVVTASVAAAPEPPAALKGTWTRTVTQQDIEHAGVTEGPPPTRPVAPRLRSDRRMGTRPSRIRRREPVRGSRRHDQRLRTHSGSAVQQRNRGD